MLSPTRKILPNLKQQQLIKKIYPKGNLHHDFSQQKQFSPPPSSNTFVVISMFYSRRNSTIPLPPQPAQVEISSDHPCSYSLPALLPMCSGRGLWTVFVSAPASLVFRTPFPHQFFPRNKKQNYLLTRPVQDRSMTTSVTCSLFAGSVHIAASC